MKNYKIDSLCGGLEPNQVITYNDKYEYIETPKIHNMWTFFSNNTYIFLWYQNGSKEGDDSQKFVLIWHGGKMVCTYYNF